MRVARRVCRSRYHRLVITRSWQPGDGHSQEPCCESLSHTARSYQTAVSLSNGRVTSCRYALANGQTETRLLFSFFLCALVSLEKESAGSTRSQAESIEQEIVIFEYIRHLTKLFCVEQISRAKRPPIDLTHNFQRLGLSGILNFLSSTTRSINQVRVYEGI